MAARDIYGRLKQDHDEMKKLMHQLSKNVDEKRFMQLAEELEAHTSAEERVFYSPLIREPQTHELILEGKQEHHVVALLLRELKANRKGTDVWSAKLKVLQENVEHHIQEEEQELFPKAQGILSSHVAKQMVQQFEQAKELVAV